MRALVVALTLAVALPVSLSGGVAVAQVDPEASERVCSAADTRVGSADDRTARLARNCTAFLINRAPKDSPNDRCLLSAGHCFPTSVNGAFIEFGQLNPSGDGTQQPKCLPQAAPAPKKFDIDPLKLIFNNPGDAGSGEDWAVFRVKTNPNTVPANKTAFQEQGVTFVLADKARVENARKYGYGSDGDQDLLAPNYPLNTFCACTAATTAANAADSQTQQTSTGMVGATGGAAGGNSASHNLHTCGGDSGSPILRSDERVTVIQTGGDCNGATPANSGTDIKTPRLLRAIGTLCPNIPGADHYLCYKAKDRNRQDPPVVSLTDQFESASYDIRPARLFCPPANKNGEGINDSSTHLKQYPIKRVSGRHTPQTRMVVNQFGELVVRTIKETALLVPTSKSLALPPVPPPSPPNPSGHNVDHFKCYKIRVDKTLGPSFPKGIVVSVVDQFGARSLALKKPFELCNPVDKNGEGIKDATRHLLCYKVKPTPKSAPPDVQVNNQFGPELLDLSLEKEFCVPSTKFEVP